jgi:metal-responsive CopG/Arc/MetJ family transcriptional regulator
MKTAVSIPDDVYKRAEEFAQRNKISRSSLYAVAVAVYVQQHFSDDITRKLNDVYSSSENALDPVLDKMQMLSLDKEEW